MSLRQNYKTTEVNFSTPNESFAVLQNVKFDLRTSDGDFANIKEIAIEKRKGTATYGDKISTTENVHTLIPYTNNDSDYLIAGCGSDLYKFVETTLSADVAVTDTTISLTDGTDFASSGTIFIGSNEITYTSKLGNNLLGATGISKAHSNGDRVIQRVWKSIKGGLTNGEYFGYTKMQSYSGTATETGTAHLNYIGKWITVEYDANTKYTTLTDASASWVADELIGRKVEVNTGDFPDLEYVIIKNGTNFIRVEGNIAGAYTTTTSAIGFSTSTTALSSGTGTVTLTLTDASAFASSGTINMENDIITYTAKSGNNLTIQRSSVSSYHPIGTQVNSAEVNLSDSSKFGDSGEININGDTCYFNGKQGTKLLNLSNITKAYASGVTVYTPDSKSSTGKSYKISFVTESLYLIDTTKNWTEDAYEGNFVVLTGGKGAGQMRMITSNKFDYLSLAFPFEDEPDSTTTYSIYSSVNQVLYMGNGTDNMLRYDGTTVTELPNSPKGNIFLLYESRMMVVDSESPFTIRYSDVGDPEYFSAIYTITPPGDDKITGLGEWNGKGIIFKEKSIWQFYFTYNSQTSQWDVNLSQIPSPTGCVSNRTIKKIENVLWYYDGKEVKYLGASDTQIGVIRVDDISFEIKDKLDAVNSDNYSKSLAMFDGQNYLLSLYGSSDSTYNDTAVDYDTKYSAWSTRAGNNMSSFAIYNSNKFYGSSTDGQVYIMDQSDYNDDGTAIEMIVTTKDTDLGNPLAFKTFRFYELGFENQDGSVEYKTKVYTTKYALTREGKWDLGLGLSSSATLSSSILGSASLGGASETPRRIVRKVSMGQQGERTQLILKNNDVDENITITNISIVWYARRMRHFPSSLIS